MAVALWPAYGYGAATSGDLIENGKVWRDVAGHTINAHGGGVLKVAGRDDACIAMFDRWNPSCLKDSRYLWLPVSLGPEGITVEWNDGWTPSEQW